MLLGELEAVMKRCIPVLLISLALAACKTTGENLSESDAPLYAALAGQTLENRAVSFHLHENGTLSGTGVKGTWEVKDGKFCRTLSQPASLAGSDCQAVLFDGDLVTFFRSNGTKATYRLR